MELDRGGASGLVRRILREPLLHFLVLGLAIFLAAHWFEARSKRYTIEVGTDQVKRISEGYLLQYGAPPTTEQLKTLVDDQVREEIFLREGLALGLDRNDEIVRRRIAQKYDFLQQDMAAPRAPSDGELRSWYAAHQAQYAEPGRRSFDHVYFAIDQRGEAAAKALAAAVLARLQAGGAAPGGDPFPGPKIVRQLSQANTDRLFGGEGFAARIFAAPPGKWDGPFRSGFGWHVIRVTEVVPPRLRGFEAARDDARDDWMKADRIAQNRASYAALRARYRVTRADVKP